MESQPARILEPLIVQASLDPDAVKICRRLKRFGHEAYLVGGCVRDLSLGHIPKDFDVATSARPRQIKRLFRNARIIGRRFKLVHIQFGDKIIEVSTFRKNPNIDAETAADLDANRPPEPDLPPGVLDSDESDDAENGGDEASESFGAERQAPRASEEPIHESAEDAPDTQVRGEPEPDDAPRGSFQDDSGSDDAEDEEAGDEDGNGGGDLMIRRDNVFGTAHEDAVRRDFTINALFYDVDDNVVIDYVGGAEDLAKRVIRTIGDPVIRFQEDPVRILRAIKFAARLEFQIDPATYSAMVQYCGDLRKCAPPRLTEELLKILSCGASHKAWALMRSIGVVEAILPEIHDFIARTQSQLEDGMSPGDRIGRYLEVVDAADRGRRIFGNATLLTSLLAMPIREAIADQNGPRDPGMAADRVMRPFSQRMAISRRDAFRVKQIVVAQSRFRKPKNSRRRRRVKPIEFVRRDYFKDSFDFYRIESRASGEGNESEIRRWLDLWYGFLRQHHPSEFHRARRESLFEDPNASAGDSHREPRFDAHSQDSFDGEESDSPDAESSHDDRDGSRRPHAAAEDDPNVNSEDSSEDSGELAPSESGDGGFPSDRNGDGERRGRRRRRGRRGRGRDRDRSNEAPQDREAREPRATEGSPEGDPSEPASTDVRAPERSRGDRRRDDRGRSDRHAPRSVDSASEESSHASEEQPTAPENGHDGEGGDRRGRRRRRRGRRGGERGRHDENAPANGNRGGHGPRATEGESRRDFDRRGRPQPVEPEPEEEEEIVEIPWDAPFQTVDDPGPISMIRTGVDQTEKKSRRRRRKLDGAARELSKEVEDQPALQAFKMIEGDPRGHEATRPRKQKRRPDDDDRGRDREKPFDFYTDFEAIESLFAW